MLPWTDVKLNFSAEGSEMSFESWKFFKKRTYFKMKIQGKKERFFDLPVLFMKWGFVQICKQKQ